MVAMFVNTETDTQPLQTQTLVLAVCFIALSEFPCPQLHLLGFISITQYHDIDRTFVNLAISRRQHVGRYRA